MWNSNKMKTITIVRSHKTEITISKHLIYLFHNFFTIFTFLFSFLILSMLYLQELFRNEKKNVKLKTTNSFQLLTSIKLFCIAFKNCKTVQLNGNFFLFHERRQKMSRGKCVVSGKTIMLSWHASKLKTKKCLLF